MSVKNRSIRLQIMLNGAEVQALDDWRFEKRMPSRASAVREIIRRGLAAHGFAAADGTHKSADYGAVDDVEDVSTAHGRSTNGNGKMMMNKPSAW